ncbi:MAG: Uncharacterised protein [Arcobacter lacus]|nr:MAG: Uncharacterised protein [Arcobacter lacus]
MNNKLQNIILKTKRKFFSHHNGENTSYFNGSGLEFNEVRQYNIDDDIRHINWKITARTRTPSVNLYFENRSIDVCIVYLNSGGLFFGEDKKKKETADEILTSLSFIVPFNNDNLSTIFYDNTKQTIYKATKNKKQVHINNDHVKALDPLNKNIDYKHLEKYLLQNVKKKSILFFIGDFLEIPNFELLSKKYEIYCVVVRHKDEEKIDFNGECIIIDTNTTNQKSMNINNDIVKQYNKYMIEYDKDLFNYFKENRVHFNKIYTHENSIEKLALLLK